MNKRTIILTVIAIGILCLSIVGLSFAYFTTGTYKEDNINVNVETSSNASIYYDTGDDLILNANQPGYSEERIFSIKLNGDNDASITGTYDINMVVNSNNFEYDPNSNENIPELIYSLYLSNDKISWQEVIKNADATELNGKINLVDSQKIYAEANSEVTQFWKIVFTYVSLDKNQSYNMNKNFSGYIKVENVE